MKRNDPQPLAVIQRRTEGIRHQWDERRKYRHTESTDALIRKAYHHWYDFGNKKAIQNAADKIGWPKWVLTHRARVLGLSRTKETPWTKPEEKLLEQWGWMSDKRIALKFRAAGYQRSETAIHLKMKRLAVKRYLDGYTLRGTAALFGVDEHKISLWIKRGMLKANQTGIGAGANEKLFIRRDDIQRFILNYPDEVDIYKWDKFLLLEIVSGGRLCEEFRKEVA